MNHVAELIAPALSGTEVNLGERYGLPTPTVNVIPHGVVVLESPHRVFSLSKFDLARMLVAAAGERAHEVLDYVTEELPAPPDGTF